MYYYQDDISQSACKKKITRNILNQHQVFTPSIDIRKRFSHHSNTAMLESKNFTLHKNISQRLKFTTNISHSQYLQHSSTSPVLQNLAHINKHTLRNNQNQTKIRNKKRIKNYPPKLHNEAPLSLGNGHEQRNHNSIAPEYPVKDLSKKTTNTKSSD